MAETRRVVSVYYRLHHSSVSVSSVGTPSPDSAVAGRRKGQGGDYLYSPGLTSRGAARRGRRPNPATVGGVVGGGPGGPAARAARRGAAHGPGEAGHAGRWRRALPRRVSGSRSSCVAVRAVFFPGRRAGGGARCAGGAVLTSKTQIANRPNEPTRYPTVRTCCNHSCRIGQLSTAVGVPLASRAAYSFESAYFCSSRTR